VADRVLNVRVTGDTSGLGRSFQKASTQSKSFGDGMHRHVVGTLKEVGKAAEYAGGLIGISFVAAIGDGIRIAGQNQVALTKLKKSVDNSGLSWKQLGGQIKETQDKLAGLSGFTNTDLETSLATLVTTTGKVTSAQKLQGEAMDLARAKGMSLSQASVILSKAWNGSTTSLTRLGIYLHKSTANYDAYMASTTHATAAGKAAAKQADLVANRQGALAQLQKKFGGSYKAYANTAAGALGRIRASADILLERLGNVLLPYLNKFAAWFAQNLPMIQQKGTAVFGALRDVILQIVDAVKFAIGFYGRWSVWIQAIAVFVGTLVLGFEAYLAVQKAIVIATRVWTAAQWLLNAAMDANPLGIAIVAAAALAAAFVVLWKRSGTFRDIVRSSLAAIQAAFQVVVGFIQAHWKTMLTILTGGWFLVVQQIINHWSTIKAAANHVVGFIIDRWGNIRSALSTFAGWVNKYVIGPIKKIISWAQKAIGFLEQLSLGSGSLGGAAGRQARGGSSAPSGAAQNYANSQMSRYGWNSSQMGSLIPLWNQESGWNNMAYNSKSGATGIPQALPYSKMPQAAWLPFQGGSADMKTQVNWGLNYIKTRPGYGSPAAAWAHEVQYNWYDKGGVVPGPRGVHRPIWAAGGETILPTHKGSAGQMVVIDMRGSVVASERDAELLVRKALGRAIRSGNPVSIGGKTIR
jgi:hypothetical protein